MSPCRTRWEQRSPGPMGTRRRSAGRWSLRPVLRRIILKDLRIVSAARASANRRSCQDRQTSHLRGRHGGPALGTAVLIAGLELPATIALLLGSCRLGIEWMLVRLARTDDERAEQVAIGIAARARERTPPRDPGPAHPPGARSGRACDRHRDRLSRRGLRRVVPGRGTPSGAGADRLQGLTRGRSQVISIIFSRTA